MRLRLSAGSPVSRRMFLAASAAAPALLRAGEPLSRAEKEAFLREAKIVRVRELSRGITNSRRATMQQGDFVHDAHVQSIDEYKLRNQLASGTELNFRDSYRFNIAAFRLSDLLGLDMVPVSVERKVHGDTCAVTWWVDDVLMVEKDRWKKDIEPPDIDAWNQQMYRARLFNELTYNTDPNLGNMVIDERWKIWLIDYTRAFRIQKKIREAKNLEKIDRQILARLRKLDEPDIVRVVEGVLNKGEIRGLLARRVAILDHFDKRAAADPSALIDWIE